MEMSCWYNLLFSFQSGGYLSFLEMRSTINDPTGSTQLVGILASTATSYTGSLRD